MDRNTGEDFLVIGRQFSISKDGILYFVDFNDHSVVRKFGPTKDNMGEKFIDLKEWLKEDEHNDFHIDDLWLDPLGRLILAESTTGKILRISPDARKMENLADSYDGYRFSTIAGLTGSPLGDLFIGSPNSATVYRHDPTLGKLFVLNEDLVRSNDLLIDSIGSRLLVAESGPNRVVVYDLNCSGGLSRSWNLVKFPKGQAKPLSIDFLNNEENLLVVLLDRGKKLQILDLRRGKLLHSIELPFICQKIRSHGLWIYMQTKKGIRRIKAPTDLFYR
jgi:sugar lactone lactonase YvrE